MGQGWRSSVSVQTPWHQYVLSGALTAQCTQAVTVHTAHGRPTPTRVHACLHGDRGPFEGRRGKPELWRTLKIVLSNAEQTYLGPKWKPVLFSPSMFIWCFNLACYFCLNSLPCFTMAWYLYTYNPTFQVKSRKGQELTDDLPCVGSGPGTESRWAFSMK